ncbi:MAG: carbohydrate kinase family protein, partial [Patescibacteria group bacterium]|nr:carbohydrate kinase family protein [Patescibacteria group bacterium]
MVNWSKLLIVGFLANDTNIINDVFKVMPGGAAYFVSLVASLYIKKIGLVTRIGRDFNEKTLPMGILKTGIKKIKGGKTFRSIQTYHNEKDFTDRDIKIIWGVAKFLTPKDIPQNWLTSAKWVHVATMPPAHQAKFVKFLKQKAPQAKMSIDTDLVFLKDKKLQKIIKENFKQADLVFVNRREYEILKPFLDKLKRVVVKLDEAGAKYLEKGKIICQVKAKKVKVKEVTGAGDIFAGAFIVNQYLGKPIKQCLKTATDLATKSVKQEGVEHLFWS